MFYLVYHAFAKASTHDNLILDYFITLFLSYERWIRFGLQNSSRMVNFKEVLQDWFSPKDEDNLFAPGSNLLFLTLPIFHESFLLTPDSFSLETKKYLHRHPVGS